MFNSSSKFREFKGKRKGKIWQLFRATDFTSLMYPCFTFCRILGIFPYKINASTIKICKPSYILSIIIFCGFCIIEFINLYDVTISTNPVFKDTRYSTPKALERGSFFIFGGCTVVTTFILNRPRMRFLQTLLDLSLKLSPQSYQNLSKLIHTKDIFGFFFLIVHVPIYMYVIRYSILCKLLILYIAFSGFQMDMLYMNCVCVLKACFKQINDNLANLRKLVANGELYLLGGTYHEQKYPFLLMEIIAVEKQHLSISKTVQMLNIVFSLQLLFTVVLTFTEITFNLYFSLLQIQETTSMSYLEKQIYYESFITCIIFYCIKMVLIVWACETSKKQAMEIRSTVHDVFNSTNNKQIKYELQLFSLQLLHHENTFSIKGFTVDATLLTAIAGGITTYLLILIQLVLSNSCEVRSALQI